MTKIAFLGLGAMGSRMAAHLLKGGHELVVWNRTPAATEPLTQAGATAAPTPRAAAKGAEVVMSMVRDDAAARQVWLDPDTGALAGMGRGALAVESSTVTPGWIAEFGAAAERAGVSLIDAPVSGSRPQADAAQLVYLVGGEAADVERATPMLRLMGFTVHHAGPLGAGAVVKLAVNALMGVQVAAMAELIALVRRTPVDPARALEIIGATSVCSLSAKAAAGLMLAGDDAPRFPVELILKDFGYAREMAGASASAPVIAATQSVFQAAADRSLGGENMTSVVKLYEHD